MLHLPPLAKNILFDQTYFEALKQEFPPIKQRGDRQHQSYPESLVTILNIAVDYSFNPAKHKALDLGSGNGYVVAALASYGCRAYGIEQSQEIIDTAIASCAHLELPHQPQFMKADYLVPETHKQRFPDGTFYQEIDLFYCFVYNSKHAIKTIVHAFAAQGSAKQHSQLALTGFYPDSDISLFNHLGIEPLFLDPETPYSLFRKARQCEIPHDIEKDYNYQESL